MLMLQCKKTASGENNKEISLVDTKPQHFIGRGRFGLTIRENKPLLIFSRYLHPFSPLEKLFLFLSKLSTSPSLYQSLYTQSFVKVILSFEALLSELS
jgi:hypothetical protein